MMIPIMWALGIYPFERSRAPALRITSLADFAILIFDIILALAFFAGLFALMLWVLA